MKVVHMESDSLEALIEHRRRLGIGQLDECWKGVWHLVDPTGRHQWICGKIYSIHDEVVGNPGSGTAWISINVTDREIDWTHNHRCPDGAVILKSNPGRWIGDDQVAFLGGPDLILEVDGDDGETHRKFAFYGPLGVKEVLIVHQKTRTPELWRLKGARYKTIEGVQKSEVTGLEYSKGPGGLEVRDPATGRGWVV